MTFTSITCFRYILGERCSEKTLLGSLEYYLIIEICRNNYSYMRKKKTARRIELENVFVIAGSAGSIAAILFPVTI